jgi:hypothetical protein
MSSASNYWGTERVKSFPQTLGELEQLWGDIRAEFRPRSPGREGCLYTNHQGFIAIHAAINNIQSIQTGQALLPIDRGDGVTSSIIMAVRIAETLRLESMFWSGKAGENFDKLAGSYVEAIENAIANNRRAVSVVDTSSNDYLGRHTLWYEKYKRRHEATHVWQFSVNSRNLGLISEQEMKADPDYPLLSKGLAGYYPDMTAEDVYSEAVAMTVAGAGYLAGFRTRKHAEAFLDRYFRQVILAYDEKALDTLHLVHPHVREVINHVAAYLGRREEKASGRNVENSAGGNGETKGIDEPTTRESRGVRGPQEHVAGGWGGDGGAERGVSREQIVAGAGRVSASKHPDQSLREHGSTGSELPTTGQPSVHLIAALGKISTIEAADPSGLRTWKELALSAGNIAREAITGTAAVQPMKEKELVLALEKVAALAPIDSQGVRHSWKEITLTASAIAREAIEKTHLITNSIYQANNAVEAANSYRNEQRGSAQSQGFGW